jgi:dTDP-4-dehydrorhamnose 3,5-epimerase
MKVTETELPGVLILEPRGFRDERGYFFESWNEACYQEAGIEAAFVQDNLSFSGKGVLRGLHFQVPPHAQGKLVSVLQGAVFDVAVDLRTTSPAFGQWMGVELSSENMLQMYIPEGFAHGFVVTSDTALFSYKCTDFYAPEYERSLRWDDPEMGIQWPVKNPVLSSKDADAPALADLGRRTFPGPRSPAAIAAAHSGRAGPGYCR